uniref:Uncharacterized protein n=1 Tax=Meloidogyne enterolobii TaxID=390850 RepID=A0A6V7VGC8_MELEN|nr:unnamed protein product [Meloidogyne enterolobii]
MTNLILYRMIPKSLKSVENISSLKIPLVRLKINKEAIDIIENSNLHNMY